MDVLRPVAASFIVILLGSASLRAQPAAEPASLRGESPQTRKRLAEAEQKVLGGKAAEAIDDLQRVLDEAGDDLISVDGKHHRAARWIAHQILAELPPDVLKTYQDRIDEPARKLLEAGKRDRDPKPLWQLLDHYFVARPSEAGLLLLGDLLFERGDFRLAELTWKRLLPDGETDVSFPGAKTDLASLRARTILAAIFQGERDRAKEELAAFEKKHPNAKGPLAGKNGPFAEIIRGYLERPLPTSAVADRAWPTFGGDPARSGRLHGSIPIHWPSKPTWTAAIPGERHALPIKGLRPPFGQPVILNGWVYVSDGHRIFAFELNTGNSKTIYPPLSVDADRKPTDPLSSPTLSTAHGRLFARLGTPSIRPPELQKPTDSAIICFEPVAKPGPNAPPMRELWRIKPPLVDGKPLAVWEGSPLVANGRLWAAFARFEGARVVHGIACYDPADADVQPERPAWFAEVCDSPLLSGSEMQARGRHELISLAGRNIVFNSNGGAVVALEAASGRRAWGFQYPRAARRLVDANRSPDPAPAVVDGGRVYVAPADAERVFALDSETGQELWESGPTEGAQILGVVRNRVIVTTAGQIRGIRGLSTSTGSYLGPDGWIQANGLLGYGRGLASDDAILWPSRSGLYFLDPETGHPIRTAPPLHTTAFHLSNEAAPDPFGSLAFADGWLVVVTPQEVWAYRTEAPPFLRPPDDPRRNFLNQMGRVEKDLMEGNGAAAREELVKAIQSELPKSLRAWAAARLLLLDRKAIEVPVELRGEWLLTAEGELVSLGSLADRIAGRATPMRGVPASPSLPADRKPLDAPSLDSEARIASTLRLPPHSFPLPPIAGASQHKHIFVMAAKDVLAIALEGETKTTFASGDGFTQAADLTEGFVLVGPFAVAVYGPGREPLWVFRVPQTDPLPGSRTRTIYTEPLPLAELSSFVLAGEWLIARLGDRHLLALDLKAHSVAWVLGTHGQPRYEPLMFETAPRFTPHFFVSERLLAVQLSDGRRWFVRLNTGRVWNEVPDLDGSKTSLVPWSMSPIEVEGNRIAFPDGPGLVRFAKQGSGKTKFAYEAPGESSLAGDPPQLRRFGEALLVAIRRNVGIELDRIEPTDGKPAWPDGPAFIDAGNIDLNAADADPQRVFIPAGNSLLAFSLDDGKLAWKAELPGCAHWVVRAGRKVAIAYPTEAVPDEPFASAWHRLRESFLRNPQPWRLPLLASALYDCWTERTVPVLLFDLETGKLLKSLTIPTRGPCLTAWLEGDVAAIATSDRICWLK